MLKRREIGKWLILIFFICFLSSGSASADDSKFNNSEYNEISNSSIKEFANDSSFIAYRGTLPETIDQEWENSIADCWLNLTRIGPSYSEFDSSITSVAASNVIIIELGSAYKEEVDDSKIDEIYQKIDNYCEQQEGISEIPVVFMWAQDEGDLPLPDYGPQIFKQVKNESGFIATRGTMPEIHQEEEKREWIDLLTNCSRSRSRPAGINPYLTAFGGPVNSFGADIHGYLIVGFEPSTPEKVNESVIDKIYQVIDEHFEQKGISNVPVVFIFVQITDDLAPADGSDANENNDNNLSDNKEEIAGNEKINQMPGFTSIMVILGLLLFLIVKRS
ncbi:hypothetical protein RG963_16290 [Methanosarcina sp. Z-7115]|uniref:DUF4038 domain-containing protein n=1 Tax=Methanosarcina baikalica TaxID=3073890 RepID=A0ABU2D5Q3_9EURY|nr:hypothetical protein [Methanosarcina sp. Z-7115]MDR7667303.1 hypothetical protein [Methanosarcina sp. Z-7115]